MTWLRDRLFWILLLIAGFYFFWGNGQVHLTDPDEAFYALTAKEMSSRGEWLTPYIFNFPQFEKPILTYWLLLVSIKLDGFHPAALRFFPALSGLITVMAVYGMAWLLYRDRQKAFLSGFILATSGLFLGMGKMIFTDTLFTMFITLALLSFLWGYRYPNRFNFSMIGFYVFSALAVLTKGPLGLFIGEATIILFLLFRQDIAYLRRPMVLFGYVLGLGIFLPWYIWTYMKYGQAFIHEFFYNDHWRRWIEAEHIKNDRWYFYPMIMLGGMMPFGFWLLRSIKNLYQRLGQKNVLDADHWLLSWVLVVFILFQCGHSKLASYILPLFPALAILISDNILRQWSNIVFYATITLLVLIAGACLYAPYIKKIPIEIPHDFSYLLSAALIVIAGISTVFVFNRLYKQAIYTLGLTLGVILLAMTCVLPIINPIASTYEMSLYLPPSLPKGDVILCSKMYARGIHMHSGLPVAVMDIGGRGFFSPHPIMIIDKKEQLARILSEQKVTWAFLKNSWIEFIGREFGDKYQITRLKAFTPNVLVKIEPKAKIE